MASLTEIPLDGEVIQFSTSTLYGLFNYCYLTFYLQSIPGRNSNTLRSTRKEYHRIEVTASIPGSPPPGTLPITISACAAPGEMTTAAQSERL